MWNRKREAELRAELAWKGRSQKFKARYFGSLKQLYGGANDKDVNATESEKVAQQRDNGTD